MPKIGSNGLFLSDEEVQYNATFGEEHATAVRSIRNQAAACKAYIYKVLADESPSENQVSTMSLLWAR